MNRNEANALAIEHFNPLICSYSNQEIDDCENVKPGEEDRLGDGDGMEK